MKIAYFDCFSGVSGDMILGALVDAGCPLGTLNEVLGRLRGLAISLSARKVLRGGIQGTKVEVHLPDARPGPPLSYGTMREILEASPLEVEIKETCGRILERLAASETRVHGDRGGEVRFHELGDPDTVADVVGAVAGLRILGIERVAASPVNVGAGTISGSHGLLPVPGPAAADLLKGTPVYGNGPRAELATPTGAALITSLSASFGALPPVRLLEIGYGAGEREFPELPNLLRLLVGEEDPPGTGRSEEEIAVLETNIDDMNPEFFDHVFERAYRAGALEVYLTPVIMKKNRPGSLLSVLCPPEAADLLADLLLTESSSFGVRYYRARRRILDREVREVSTAFGTVRVKLGKLGERLVQTSPEFEDCKRLARERDVPVRVIYFAAQQAAEAVAGARGETSWRA